jgi:hypothetical protein
MVVEPVMSGAVTVARMVRLEAGFGVENPAGVPTVRLEVPAPTGWNVVVAVVAPAAKTTGLVVMVPTAVLELVKGTLTGVTWGMTVELVMYVKVPELRMAGTRVMELGVAKVVVLMLPGV